MNEFAGALRIATPSPWDSRIILGFSSWVYLLNFSFFRDVPFFF
jgi:hypothetical protein